MKRFIHELYEADEQELYEADKQQIWKTMIKEVTYI